MSAADRKHGRWTGLFLLGQECGALISATAEILFDPREPLRAIALAREIADAEAAIAVFGAANGLALDRVANRATRRAAELGQRSAIDAYGETIRCAGVLVREIGKTAAYPEGDEHPDGGGNLTGRLENGIADVTAAITALKAQGSLDTAAIAERSAARREMVGRLFFPTGALPAEALR